jgi:putative membrane protein
MPIAFHHTSPFGGLIFFAVLWVVQLVIGYFVYKDAEKQKMSAPLWFILVAIPFFGYFLAVLYVIIREVRKPVTTEKEPLDILRDRFARGEISAEEYEKGKALITKD